MWERPMLKGEKWELKEEEEEEEEDMMSELPDEILVLIMCCLTTEQAATMSLVSRRWQKIWNTAIPVMRRLTFHVFETGWRWLSRCDQETYTSDKINNIEKLNNIEKIKINLLNKVLKMHKAPTLDEFSFIALFLRPKHSHHIHTWMDFAAKKHVKKLYLSSLMAYDPIFVADNFHSLKELVMEGIDVTENFIHRLFSNSPFLERFSLLRSYTLQKLNIASAPNLKYLKVGDCVTLRHLEITSAQNLNTLEITGFVTLESLNISAPNLSHLLLCIHRRTFKFNSYLTLLGQIKRLTLVIQGHPAEDSGLKWLDEHIPSKVEVNQKYSCKYVKSDGFAGCQHEVEFLLHLLKYAVIVEKLIIQLMPSTAWRLLSYEDKFDNRYELLCLGCDQQLKTRICQIYPNAEVIVKK